MTFSTVGCWSAVNEMKICFTCCFTVIEGELTLSSKAQSNMLVSDVLATQTSGGRLWGTYFFP